MSLEALNRLRNWLPKINNQSLNYLLQTIGRTRLIEANEINDLKDAIVYVADNMSEPQPPIIQIPDLTGTGEIGKLYQTPDGNLYTWNGSGGFVAVIAKEKYYLVFDNWIQGKDNVNWYGRQTTPQNNTWGQDSDAQVFNMGTNVNNIFYTNTNVVMPFDCRLIEVTGRLKQNAYRDADLKFLNYTSDKVNVFNIQEILNVDIPAYNTLNFVFNSNLTIPKDSFITTVFKQKNGSVGAFNYYLLLTFEKL